MIPISSYLQSQECPCEKRRSALAKESLSPYEKGATKKGGVAEWSIASVLKTEEPQGSVGSNPTPSATSEFYRVNGRKLLEIKG